MSKASLSNVDNFNIWATNDNAQLGAAANLDVGTSGILHLDEFVMNDDGNPIGPVTKGFAYTF